MTTHLLKTWPAEFQAVADGTKRFEFRRDDRGFAVGDELRLQEWEPCSGCSGSGRQVDVDDGESIACNCAITEHPFGSYTGRETTVRVTYLLRGPTFGAPGGYVVMSVVPTDTTELAPRFQLCDRVRVAESGGHRRGQIGRVACINGSEVALRFDDCDVPLWFAPRELEPAPTNGTCPAERSP